MDVADTLNDSEACCNRYLQREARFIQSWKHASHYCKVLKSADTVALYPRSTDCWQAWVGIRSRWALVDAAELHRTARQRKRNRQCSLSETAVTELHRALSRGFISRLVNSDASRLYGDSLTAKRSIKAKLGGNCLRCCHTVPVLPIGQQVLYFLPYGQWVGIRSRRALLGNHLWHSGRVKPRGMQFHFLLGGYCSKPPFGSCKR